MARIQIDTATGMFAFIAMLVTSPFERRNQVTIQVQQLDQSHDTTYPRFPVFLLNDDNIFSQYSMIDYRLVLISLLLQST